MTGTAFVALALLGVAVGFLVVVGFLKMTWRGRLR
jgi:hypothetical protein